MSRRIALLILFSALSLLALAALPLPARAQPNTPARAAENIRAALVQAQLNLTSDQDSARQLLAGAEATYQSSLEGALAQAMPIVDGRIQDGFAAADQALAAGDTMAFAAARAAIWTGLLDGSYRMVEQALQQNDGTTVRAWLALREFRTATRFSRPNADATLAINRFVAGTIAAADALAAVRADLLDTYQARLAEALNDLSAADAQGFATRRVEAGALAEGYFMILAPAYREQHGDAALAEAQRRFAALHAAAVTGQGLPAALAAIEADLTGFRAEPLSGAEQARRAGQMLRFLGLVPIEYDRGVRNSVVTSDLEVQEARTFRDGAAAAFADLRGALDRIDRAKTSQIARQLDALGTQLAAANAQSAAEPEKIQANSDQILALLREVLPAEWQQHNSGADFDAIQASLDQLERAAAAGQYDLAESARLDAYAVLESGPEAKLVVFAPQLKQPIEDLFWYGQGEYPGLATLIDRKAPLAAVAASRQALDRELATAEQALSGNNAPAAVAANAALIVFREGLEAVLILASLMGSMKVGAQKRLRRPLWLGTTFALLASALTWILARNLLATLARYGERLEAVVSLIAIVVLLLITNWFFHHVYWTGWMANFHRHKKRIVGGDTQQFIGLVVLGFTSIYREGFETVLFLQALVLESGTATVLGGVAPGWRQRC